MSKRTITPGNSKITLEGLPSFLQGDVSVVHRPETAAEASELVAELGGSEAFEVVDSRQGWLRLRAEDVSIEIMGPPADSGAEQVVAWWQANPDAKQSGIEEE